MSNIFAHLGLDHTSESLDSMTTLDHCMSIIIGAGIIITILIAVIVYLMTTRQPKGHGVPTRTKRLKNK